MKMYEIGIDANGRSTPGEVEIPLTKISETESISPKQPGLYWRIGMRPTSKLPRTSPDYDPPGGAYEMHLGGEPHVIAWLSGHNDSGQQDGSTMRFAPGDLLYVRPGALHHSNLNSTVPPTVFNLYLPGKDTDIGPFQFKK